MMQSVKPFRHSAQTLPKILPINTCGKKQQEQKRVAISYDVDT